jgi:phage gp29-like protein
MDSQVSKAVLGQTMTTDDGSSRAQAEVHDEVRTDLRDADAGQLAETLERDLVIPYIVLNHGPQKAYPKVCLREPESADVTVLSEALGILVPLGLRVEASEVRDKLGFSDPAPDAECLQQAPVVQPDAPPPQAVNRAVNSAAATRFSADQQALEDLVAGVVPEGATVMAGIGTEIDDLIRQAKSFDELRILLADYLDQVADDELQDTVHRSLVAADLWGRVQVEGDDEA